MSTEAPDYTPILADLRNCQAMASQIEGRLAAICLMLKPGPSWELLYAAVSGARSARHFLGACVDVLDPTSQFCDSADAVSLAERLAREAREDGRDAKKRMKN